MAVKVIMPKLTHDMQSGTLIRWLVEEGQPVRRGEPLFEVETDKAVTEVDADAQGMLRGVRFREGESVPIGEIMAYIASVDEVLLDSDEQKKQVIAGEAAPLPERKAAARSMPAAENFQAIIATPIARRIAREKGIDLSQLKGSGPRSRIVEADLLAYLDQHRQPAPAPVWEMAMEEAAYPRLPLTQVEQATGRRMLQSVQSMPQFTLEIDVDMHEASRWREHVHHTAKNKISFTAILVRMVVAAIKRHPRLNAHLDGDALIQYPQVNLGVAVATPQGLLVPVIRAVDHLNLAEIQEQLSLIQEQAQVGRLPVERLSGACMTISNLGMFGIDRFQAIINPPETAILAIGRIREMPWVVDGKIEIRPILTIRLTIDHRVADGATAAPFLLDISQLLGNPYLLL